jgi:Ubiquitin family
VFTLQVNVNNKLYTIEVRETDTVASLINTCEARFKDNFLNKCPRVLHNGVDLATLDQDATLADLNINEHTQLHVEAQTSSTNNSNVFNINVKTLTGKQFTINDVNSNW